MDRVEDWIGEFYVKHTDRCPREDWPQADTEAESSFIDAWRHAFVTRGVEHPLADAASLDMAGEPPRFLDQHLPTLVKLAMDLRRLRDAGLGLEVQAGTVESASVASRDCPDCGGSGGAVRYVHEDILGRIRTLGGNLAPLGSAVAYPCSCPLGRLVARGLRQGGQAAEPPTIDQYPRLRLRPVRWSDSPDCQYRHHPRHWDEEAGMPVASGVFADREEVIASLKAILGLARAGRGIHQPRPPEPQGGAPGTREGHRFAGAIPDPVIRAEEEPAAAPSRPSRPEDIRIPEDDLEPLF
jgi:hypothetical protein